MDILSFLTNFLKNPYLVLVFFVVGVFLLIASFFYSFFKLLKFEAIFSTSLKHMYEKKSPFILALKAFCALFAFSSFMFLAQKENSFVYPLEQKNKEGNQLIFLVDTSLSMSIEDVFFRTRLNYVKEVIGDLVKSINGSKIALYAFNSTLVPLSPFTFDTTFTLSMVKKMTYNEGDTEGTDFVKVLNSLADRLKEVNKTPTYLFLFSDGGDYILETLPEDKKEERKKEILAAWKRLPSWVSPILVGVGQLEGKAVPHVTYKGKPVLSALNHHFFVKMALEHPLKLYLAKDQTPPELVQKILPFIQMGEEPSSLEKKKWRMLGREDKGGDLLLFSSLVALIFLFLGSEKKRKWFKTLFFIAFTPFFIEAEEIPPSLWQKEKEAIEFVELENFEPAEEIYSGLKDEVHSLEKKAIIQYNRAVMMYLQGEFEKGFFLLQSIPSQRNIAESFNDDVRYLQKKIAQSAFQKEAFFKWLFRGLEVKKEPLTLIDKKLLLQLKEEPSFKNSEAKTLWIEGQYLFLLELLTLSKKNTDWLLPFFKKASLAIKEASLEEALSLLEKNEQGKATSLFQGALFSLQKKIGEELLSKKKEDLLDIFLEIKEYYLLEALAFEERYNPFLWKPLLIWEKVFAKKNPDMFANSLFFLGKGTKEGYFLSYLSLLQERITQSFHEKEALKKALKTVLLMGFTLPEAFLKNSSEYEKKEKDFFLKNKAKFYEAVVALHKEKEATPPYVEKIVASFDKAFSLLDTKIYLRKEMFSLFLEAYLALGKEGKSRDTSHIQKKQKELEKMESVDISKKENIPQKNTGERAW